MDRKQQGLSRRDLFRNAAAAGIGLSGLLDLVSEPGASAATTRRSVRS